MSRRSDVKVYILKAILFFELKKNPYILYKLFSIIISPDEGNIQFK